MSSFVPFVEHGRHAAFPVLTAMTVFAMSVVMTPAVAHHAAEEDHFHQPEEQEEEKDGTTDRSERIKEVGVSKSVRSMRVAISVCGGNG